VRALVLGASAGVGRALSEELAARGDSLLLVASDARDLQAQAAHLRLTYGTSVGILPADATLPEDCCDRIRSAADAFGQIEAFFFPIGVSRSDDRGLLSLGESRRLLDANFLVIVAVISHFLPGLLLSKHGYIVGFGSVAALRGRRTNIVYAAAKRALESYFESLRHAMAQTDVRVQFYRLGYVSTQQSFAASLLLPAVTPQRVAREVLRNLGTRTGLIHFPRYWWLVGRMVSALPWFLYRKIEF
jgi:short-subunit dehydrogenase